MTGRMVYFRCTQCGRLGFRYRTMYERMVAESGRAWCLGCAPQAYRPRYPSHEVADAAHALIAQSHIEVGQSSAALR
jgi:hypothetical protein